MEIEHIIGQANIPRAVQSLVDITPFTVAGGTTVGGQTTSGGGNVNSNNNNNSYKNIEATRYVSAAGGCLVVNSILSPHEQVFLHATDSPLSSFRVSRSGKYIVSGHCGANADVVVWDAHTHELKMTFYEHERAVVDCDFTSDDTIVASLGAEKRLCFVDISNGALIAHIPLNAHVPDYQGPTAAANCPYNTQLIAGPRVQDAKRRQVNLFHTAVITPQSVVLLHLDPYRGTVNFSVEPARMRAQLSSFLKTFSVAQFTAFGDLLVLGTESGELALMGTENGAILQTIQACSLGVRSLCVVSTGDMGTPPSNNSNNNNNNSNNNNEFRYANFGAGSLRTSQFYVGGGDGTITAVALPNHQQVNQLSVLCKTSIVEPISNISLISPHDTPPKVLAQAQSGSIYTVDIIDTQRQVPEYDMYSKRQANGVMDTYGGRTGDAFTTAQQRSHQFKSTHSLPLNTTLSSGGGGSGGGHSAASSNVKKISDASRSPFTALVVHPIDPTRFYTASADGLLREWDLNDYRCRGIFETNTVSHGVLSKGTSANATFNNSHNPSGRGFAQTAGAGGYGMVGTRHQNALGGAAGAPAGAGGFAISVNNGVQCTMLKIAEALDLLFSCWSDGSVHCHDMSDHRLLWAHNQAHRCPITALCLTNNLKYFITGGADGEIRTWDTKTREMRGSALAHQQAVIHLEFFPTGGAGSSFSSSAPRHQQQHQPQGGQEQYILSASKDRTVCTWEIGVGFSSLRRLTSHQTHMGPLTCCKLGGFGEGEGGTLSLTETPPNFISSSSSGYVQGGGVGVGGVGSTAVSAPSSSASYFYSASLDRKIHICDLRNPHEPLRVIDYNAMPATVRSEDGSQQGHTFAVAGIIKRLRDSIESYATCFAFSSKEHMLVTGGSDAVVKVWSVCPMPATSVNAQHLLGGSPLAIAAGHSAPVVGISFTCDQKQVVSCGADGTIVVLNNYF